MSSRFIYVITDCKLFFFLWLNKGFPGGSVVKNLPANTGNVGLISGLGRFLRKGNGNPLQCSCLENTIDGWAGLATVQCGKRVGYDLATKPQYSNCMHIYICTGLPQCLSSEESACNAADVGSIPGLGISSGGGHSNPLQCSCLENPMEEEPGRLQSIGLQRVGHNWSNWACMRAYTHTHTHTHNCVLFLFIH